MLRSPQTWEQQGPTLCAETHRYSSGEFGKLGVMSYGYVLT